MRSGPILPVSHRHHSTLTVTLTDLVVVCIHTAEEWDTILYKPSFICLGYRSGCWAAMMTTIQLAGVRPEVTEESIACRCEGLEPRDPPDFETQGRYHQKSKTGVSVTAQKGLVSSSLSSTAGPYFEKVILTLTKESCYRAI